jgi:hypothetical protein
MAVPFRIQADVFCLHLLFFHVEQNALAFNWDTWCHVPLGLQVRSTAGH